MIPKEKNEIVVEKPFHCPLQEVLKQNTYQETLGLITLFISQEILYWSPEASQGFKMEFKIGLSQFHLLTFSIGGFWTERFTSD